MRTESEVLIQNPNSSIIDYRQVVRSNLEEISKMSSLVEDLLLIARTENTLDVSNLEKGVYMIRMLGENAIASKQFVIE